MRGRVGTAGGRQRRDPPIVRGWRELIDGGTFIAGPPEHIDPALNSTLDAPYSNFDAVAGFQLFFPVPEAADAARDGYQDELMVGNGPYTMESPRSDEEIVLVRNDSWAGDFNGETWPGRPERIVLRVFADVDTSYNALEAGEVDNATIPPARSEEARSNWGTTLDTALLASYPLPVQPARSAYRRLGEPAAAPGDLDGRRPRRDQCEYCAYDPEAAQAAYDDWVAAGNEPETIPIQINADAGHEPVVAIIIDNLAAIGIEAEADPRINETYFSELGQGACVFCRIGWTADYPTYDNFMYDQYHSDSLDGNNYGYSTRSSTPDRRSQGDDRSGCSRRVVQRGREHPAQPGRRRRPDQLVLGDYADVLEGFGQNPLALITWEQIVVTRCAVVKFRRCP